MRNSRALIILLAVLTAALIWGCSKSKDTQAATSEAVAEAKAPEGAEAKAPEGDKAKAPEGDKAKAPEGDKAKAPEGAEAKAPLTGDKAKLAKAYIDIYCAQRKGETEKLLEIYTRYGFEDPKTWTDQWTQAATDNAWVARITQEAIRTCP